MLFLITYLVFGIFLSFFNFTVPVKFINDFNGQRYKILKAELGNLNGEPGIVLTENLEIGCKEKSIKILEIQREGKNPQKIREFMLGSMIKKGSNLN